MGGSYRSLVAGESANDLSHGSLHPLEGCREGRFVAVVKLDVVGGSCPGIESHCRADGVSDRLGFKLLGVSGTTFTAVMQEFVSDLVSENLEFVGRIEIGSQQDAPAT